MQIGGIYSFNDGEAEIRASHASALSDVEQIIASVDATTFKTKKSSEKTMPGKMLYSPKTLNRAFAEVFLNRGWRKHKEYCDYPTDYYTPNYVPGKAVKGAFREMDFVKDRVGVEVQFGKYAFMVYNVAAKMTIFHNLGVIDVGIEIVPLKALAQEMSSGVSYFEQFVWDLKHRGISNIDIPVLILGVVP